MFVRLRVRKKTWKNPSSIYIDHQKFDDDIPLLSSTELFVEVLSRPERVLASTQVRCSRDPRVFSLSAIHSQFVCFSCLLSRCVCFSCSLTLGVSVSAVCLRSPVDAVEV